MSIRSSFARLVGQTSYWFLTRFTKGGSSLPGKLALQLDPQILQNLARPYDVIVITGTNGKTLTTALTVQALKEAYDHVLTNPSGSNMQQGIVGTFITAPKLAPGQRGVAVLEVDEGSLKHVVQALQPKAFVHTNVFRDQMDRYGEIYTIYDLMAEAAKSVPSSTVIANGDSPLFHGADLPNPKQYFGFDHREDQVVQAHYNTDGVLCPKCHHVLHYKNLVYANLGQYYCDHCENFSRPDLDYRVTAIKQLALTHSDFELDHEDFHIPVAGLYNVYNALAAYSVARFMGLNANQIRSGFNKAQRVFGRQEIFEIKGKKVLLNLVKNPVGLNQVLSLIGLDQHPFTLVALLNNRYADGTDVSWIWDGDYEQLSQMPIELAITGGMRSDEMTLRLKTAGIAPELLEEVDSLEAVLAAIESSPSQYVHILSTYTAMLDLRKLLQDKGYI